VRDYTTFGPSTRPVAPYAAASAMIVLLSAIVSSMAVTTVPAWTQTLKQWKCTGRPDVAWDEQISGCTNAIKSGKLGGKDLAVAFAIRGSAYRARGEPKRAVEDYDQAVKLNPHDADVFFRRGIAHGTLGDADRAMGDFDQAIKLEPDHVGALYSRGLTYSNKGQWERAIKDYDQAIKLSPNNVMAISNRGNAYLALKQYDRAIADYDRAIELDPNEAIPRNNRGDAYYQIGQADRAMDDFNAAIKLGPSTSTLSIIVAWLTSVEAHTIWLSKISTGCSSSIRMMRMPSEIALMRWRRRANNRSWVARVRSPSSTARHRVARRA
jgi:tetratricopeptide (TPR) repeat protein